MRENIDVFVSYSRKDTEIVDKICAALEDEDISYWRDNQAMAPNEYSFPERVLAGLTRANLVLIVLSANYFHSFYCLSELINTLIDAPLSHPPIRIILLDPALEMHPLIEISKNEVFHFLEEDHFSTRLGYWLRKSPRIHFSPIQVDMEENLQRLMLEMRSPDINYSIKVIDFFEKWIDPLCNIFIIGHMLLQDRLQDAIDLAEKTYESMKLRHDLPICFHGAASNRLANAYSKYGMQEKAVAIRRNEFEHDVRSFGRAHSQTMQACDNLILSLARLGEFDEAIALGESSLAVAKRSYPSTHPLVLLSANTLGALYIDQGNYIRGKIILEPIYNCLDESGLGKTDVAYLVMMVNYGFSCSRSGELAKGQTILEKCIQGYDKMNGEGSLDAADVRIKLAETYCKQERFSDAAQHAIEAMIVMEKLHPGNPVRIMAGVIAIQCCYYDHKVDAWYSLFDQFILPGLQESPEYGIGKQLRDFIIVNMEIVPPTRIFEVIKFLSGIVF